MDSKKITLTEAELNKLKDKFPKHGVADFELPGVGVLTVFWKKPDAVLAMRYQDQASRKSERFIGSKNFADACIQFPDKDTMTELWEDNVFLPISIAAEIAKHSGLVEAMGN